MEKVKSSKELLEELGHLNIYDEVAMKEFAREIGACLSIRGETIGEIYKELFHNCLDIINLRQQIEQSDVLSRQTVWIKRYTIITFALVVVTALIAIFR